MLERVHASTLQTRESSRPPIESIPLLGQPGYITSGWSHLVYGIPKGGKTCLLAQFASECGKQVLYFTEESESVWTERDRETPLGDINLVFALGSDPGEILEMIPGGDEPIVIVDTVKLFRLLDEDNNSEINRKLTPLLARCRVENKTLILGHHTRKSGGKYGLASAGGHAFMAVVDVALEVSRDNRILSRRHINGLGRVFEIPEMIYERVNKKLEYLGSPGEMTTEGVQSRILKVLDTSWKSTNQLMEEIGDPPTTRKTALRALELLVEGGIVSCEERSTRSGGMVWSINDD